MEENRYSLVAGKSRVERAKRGRTRGEGNVETPPLERGRVVRTHTEAHAYTRTLVYARRNRTTLRLGLGKTIPGKTPKIRRYETTWEIPLLPFPSGRWFLHPPRSGNIYFQGSTRNGYETPGSATYVSTEYGSKFKLKNNKIYIKFYVLSLWFVASILYQHELSF